jgi:hypothetical protein
VCAFPPDIVPEAERSASRDVAHRFAAREELAPPVRKVAANALAVIGQGSRPASGDAVQLLLSLVH